MTDNTRILLSHKLTSSMSRKCWDDHMAAFESLVDALSVVCPGIRLKDQQRYSAFYCGEKIIAYIEPQRCCIRFGLFKDYIRPYRDRIFTHAKEDFPDWNKSKGGLVGISLQGHGGKLTRCVADIAYLIIESLKKSQE